MTTAKPELIIRLGSHAEKEYVLKLAQFLGGIIVGSNLVEATSGATASLLLTVSKLSTDVYIDPMTYAFGAHTDNQGIFRNDLDWIKSDQINRENGKKTTKRDFKRSYRQLAEAFGSPLTEAVANSQAITPEIAKNKQVMMEFCRAVANYQQNRIRTAFESDDELRQYLEFLPTPNAVFAPYFYIDPSQVEDWLHANETLIKLTKDLDCDIPVHAIFCANVDQLNEDFFRSELARISKESNVSGVWLWFSGFFEDSATTETLRNYANLVTELSDFAKVYALRGGFYSMSLFRHGMTGVSHGVGYGEQKNVVPVIGQSTPTVRYYLPPVSKRLGVPSIERTFQGLGIASPAAFFENICDCAVCKGVIADSLANFAEFGDMHFSHPDSKRKAQTPAAAKRCRYHFLLSRFREREELSNLSTVDVATRMEQAYQKWGVQASMMGECDHLMRWANALRSLE